MSEDNVSPGENEAVDVLGDCSPLREDEMVGLGSRLGDPGRVGTVREIGRTVAYKRYEQPTEDSHLDMLIAWRRSLTDADRGFLDSRCAWPRRRVTVDGHTVGFLMARAPAPFWVEMLGEQHVLELQHLLYDERSAQLGISLPSQRQRIQIVKSLAEIFAFFERHKIVYADLSDKNLLWSIEPTVRVFLLDCDNVILNEVAPGTGSAVSPNWHDGRDEVDRATDRYSLGAAYYRIFYHLPGPLPANPHELIVPEIYPAVVRLERLCFEALGKPIGRPSAESWIEALEPDDTLEHSDGVVDRKFRFSLLAAYLAALILIVSVALVLFLVIHRSGTTQGVGPEKSPVRLSSVVGRRSLETVSGFNAGYRDRGLV